MSMSGTRTSTVDGWRGTTSQLHLAPEDLDLVSLVLHLDPELCALTWLAQQARLRGLRYPVKRPADLAALVAGDPIQVADHHVSAQSVMEALDEAWFPLTHEGEFLSVLRLALVRCRGTAAAVALDRLVALRDSVPPAEG
jgi:hypothetical protein